MRKVTSEIEDAIAVVLWSQWRAVGVQAATAPARGLVDPEVLLIESAIVASRIDDVRIADAAIAWSVQHHALVITARLKSILSRYDEPEQNAFLVMSRRIIDITGRLAWPAAPSASAWRPSVAVRLPRLSDRPELLRLQTRALFGANARAEALAYLACVEDQWVDLATLERATAFSKRHLSVPLESLVLEGSVERSWLGNRQGFRLASAARGLLDRSRHPAGMPAGPRWIDWYSRIQIARVLGDASMHARSSDGLVTAVGRVRGAVEQLQQQGLEVPRPLAFDEDPEERAAELLRWLADATSRVLTA